MPELGLTDTGLPGRPVAEIVALVPPVAVQESVEAAPEQTGVVPVNVLTVGGCKTVIVMSCVTEPHELVAVRR